MILYFNYLFIIMYLLLLYYDDLCFFYREGNQGQLQTMIIYH